MPDLTNGLALDCANCHPIGRSDNGETVYNCYLGLDLYGGACIGCAEYEVRDND
jgi:hypothetical protein